MSTSDLKVTRNRLKNWRVEVVEKKFSACSHTRSLTHFRSVNRLRKLLTKWKSQHCVSRRSFPDFVASLLPSSPIALLQIDISFHVDFQCLCQLLINHLFSCPKQLNRWPCHSLTHWLTHSLTDWQYFYFWHTKSDPRDLWPLRHFIRVMRKHDLKIVWNFFGTFEELFWNFFGTFLELFWNFFAYLSGPIVHFWQIRFFYNFNKDNANDKDNPRDLRQLRHWLQFWQLRCL